jgi:RNase P subunit RPR2
MTGRNSRAGSISKGAENDAWTCKECDKTIRMPKGSFLH